MAGARATWPVAAGLGRPCCFAYRAYAAYWWVSVRSTGGTLRLVSFLDGQRCAPWEYTATPPSWCPSAGTERSRLTVQRSPCLRRRHTLAVRLPHELSLPKGQRCDVEQRGYRHRLDDPCVRRVTHVSHTKMVEGTCTRAAGAGADESRDGGGLRVVHKGKGPYPQSALHSSELGRSPSLYQGPDGLNLCVARGDALPLPNVRAEQWNVAAPGLR